MAGITTNEGEAVALNLIYKNADADRGTSLVLGLFTNSSNLSEVSVWNNIIQPTSAGNYAEIPLDDALWTVSGTTEATYAKQSFTAVGAAFSADIYGYYIRTTGTNIRLLHFEVSGFAIPVLIGGIYQVDLSITGD